MYIHDFRSYIVFLPQALSSSSSEQPWHVDPSLLKSSVAAYPTLQAALFPPPPTSLTPAQSQDITVYQLLQVGTPFMVTCTCMYTMCITYTCMYIHVLYMAICACW